MQSDAGCGSPMALLQFLRRQLQFLSSGDNRWNWSGLGLVELAQGFSAEEKQNDEDHSDRQQRS